MGNFYTDVISKDRRFNSVERVSDMALLEPAFRAKVEELVRDLQAHGLEFMVFETYRSQARQQALFAQHATKLSKVGVHHYGLACDLVRNINGEPSWKGDFSPIGQLSHGAGLVWGGDWGNATIKHTFDDPGHVQRCSLARQASLFNGSWYPDGSYDPYGDPGTVR